MREIRPSGSEGGGTQPNESSLPLFAGCPWRDEEAEPPPRLGVRIPRCKACLALLESSTAKLIYHECPRPAKNWGRRAGRSL